MLEGLGDDQLAVASAFLRGAVVEDSRPSVLRWIEVVEQVSVGRHRVEAFRGSPICLASSEQVLKEILPWLGSCFSCLESCPISNDQARLRTNS